MALGEALAERGMVPDSVVRAAIRRRLAAQLRRCAAGGLEAEDARLRQLIADMAGAPIAPVPERANAQHYALPPAFFARFLGPWRKYSACYWPTGVADLASAEEAMLALTAERAELADGQEIVDLGCGWGSLSLWLGRTYPNARITAVSNSSAQIAHIAERARALGLANVTPVVGDINHYSYPGRADRVVSVEMFEHMRNYPALFARIADWLAPGGKLFMHIFAHVRHAYVFEPAREGDWMGRHFFAQGLMPAQDLPLLTCWPLRAVTRWRLDGRHYARTLEAWLANFDAAAADIRQDLADVYPQDSLRRWFQRWRLFLMASAELFGYRQGRAWHVAHYLFDKPAEQQP